jgi:hypothetical protein
LKSKEPTTLQALTIINLNMVFMEIVALKKGKHHHHSNPQPSFGSVATPTQLIVYMTMVQNLVLLIFKKFFNHMEFDPNRPLSKTLKPMLSSNAPIK